MEGRVQKERYKVEIMTNREKFIKSYSSLISLLYDLTGDIEEEKDYSKIEESFPLLNDVTTVLKRMGDSIVLDTVEQNVKIEGPIS